MAKHPPAHQANHRLDKRFNQKLFFILVIALSIVTLFSLLLSQITNVKAQTATQVINFGSVMVGQTSPTQTATFNNTTIFYMTVNVSVSGPGFAIVNNGCDEGVGGGGTCSVDVNFTPTSGGPKTGSVTFNYSYDDGQPTPSTVGAGSNAQVTGNPSTTLQGTGIAPTTAAPTTTVPTTTVATSPSPSVPVTTTAPTSAPSNNCGSQIQGYVLVDGQPGAGVGVKLTGPANNSVTIGEGGFFYFNNLCKGAYTISLDYDHSKYKANDADTRNITVDGVSASRNNAFSLSTITATTAAPTTAAPTTPAETAAPTTASAPTTPAAVPTTVLATDPACNLPGGTVLRVCVGTTQQSPTHFAVVLKVAAGDSPVDLNDTVVVSLPAGAIVTSATSALGAVNVSANNTVRWGSFSLSPKQSATIVLSIDAPAGNLNGSSIFVSGSFNRSQAFQQRIPGLPGLTDIFAAAPQTTGAGGQGGGSSVPVQAPATGTGQETSQDAPVFWLILAAIVSGGLGVFGLVMTGRTRKSGNKEQK